MTSSKLERWKREFRKAAKADRYARLREHLHKLELPDSPELLLEGTIQFVEATVVYAKVDQQSFTAFLEMQNYDPSDAEDAMFAFTFDVCGKAFGRVLVSDKVGILDLADLYNHPWDDYQLCGYSMIYISRTDDKSFTRKDLTRLEKEIIYDLQFDPGDEEIEIDFDHQSISGVIKVTVQDHEPD